MWCSVKYLGNLNPVMEWSRDYGSILDSNVSYIRASDSFTLTTTASEMMTPNDQNVTYICTTYFNAPAVPEKNGTFTARNAPEYRDECKVTIRVLCEFAAWNNFLNQFLQDYFKLLVVPTSNFVF